MKKNNRPRKLSRSHKGVKQRSVVAVLTEGEVTEPEYVKILKSIYGGVSIKIINRYAGSTPEVLVNKAIVYQRKYDEIWCLFDRNQHPKIEVAMQKASKNDIKTAITNPCFELWLVLHKEDQFGFVTTRNIQKRSRDLGITAGKHISETGKKLLRGKYNDAKNRAQHLEKIHKGKDPTKSWENPSSQVWKFVDRLALLNRPRPPSHARSAPRSR